MHIKWDYFFSFLFRNLMDLDGMTRKALISLTEEQQTPTSFK